MVVVAATQEQDPISTVKRTILDAFSSVADRVIAVVNRILPPERRETLQQRSVLFATSHPLLATLLLSQVAFSGIPLLLFVMITVGVFVFSFVAALVVAVLSALLFTVFCVGFALLLLLPTLFVTTSTGVGVWLWGWAAYHLVKWFRGADMEKQLPKLRSGLASNVRGGYGGDNVSISNETNEKYLPSYEQDAGQDPKSQQLQETKKEVDSQTPTKPVNYVEGISDNPTVAAG